MDRRYHQDAGAVIRFACLVLLLATVSLARKIVACPSANILQSVGCSCWAHSSKGLKVKCDATQWKSETPLKFLEIFNGSKIWEFTFYGKPTWENERVSTNSPSRPGTKGFSPFSALCESQIVNVEFKDFIYKGTAPECSFQVLMFSNVTMDFPLFLSGLRSEEVGFFNQKNINGLEHLRSVKHLFIFNCSAFDTAQIHDLSELTFLDIHRTDVKSPELKSEDLPRRSFNMKKLACTSCNITSVSPDLLDSLPRLSELNLQNNFIADLPKPLLENQRLSLSLAGNPLDCDRLGWLRELIHSKSIKLIDEERTYCSKPRRSRFMGERKLNLNVDVEEESRSLLSWAEISACVALFTGLGFLLIACRLQRKRAARHITWFEDPYPREDQPWMADDKNDQTQQQTIVRKERQM